MIISFFVNFINDWKVSAPLKLWHSRKPYDIHFCTKSNVNSFYQAYNLPHIQNHKLSFSCAFFNYVSVWFDSEWPWFRSWELDSCKMSHCEDHTFDPHLQEKLSLISYLNNVKGGEPFNWVSPVSLINKGWIRVVEPDYISNRRYIVSPSHAFSLCTSHAIFSKAKQRSYSSNIFNSFIRKGNK